jgi:hypothetical protein
VGDWGKEGGGKWDAVIPIERMLGSDPEGIARGL